MSDDHLAELGARVEAARLSRGWGKERAAREAEISAITWKRIEDGLSVQDAKRAAALRVLGLDPNGFPALSVETSLDPETVAVIRRTVAEEVARRMAQSPQSSQLPKEA